ncbi:MAG: metal-sensitive transcriptional regulator [Oricola sp.]|nr:metal-sensitive transcriptional regulator [Oricola sp.]
MLMSDSAAIIKRLNRIENQVRGVARMVEEDRYCIDILHQVQAIKSALSRAESEILKNHAHHCVAEAIKTGSAQAQQEKFSELVDLFEKTKR